VFFVHNNSGVHGRGIRRMMRFPRRRIIQRLIRLEEQYLQYEHEGSDDDDDNKNDIDNSKNNNNSKFAHPLGLVGPEPSNDSSELVQPILAQSLAVRTVLAKWLPITLQLNNLHLLYSTNYHGRTLERFYSHVQRSKHTVLICEVLTTETTKSDKSSQQLDQQEQQEQQQQQSTIIGMYASQAWKPSTRVYGDGGVFLFRLQPNPTCWKWHPLCPGGNTGSKRSNLLDNVNLDDDDSNGTPTGSTSMFGNNNNNNQIALLEQFMVGTNEFISIGGNPDGSSGLRINEDLTKGESSTATGFDNEPLHGINKGSVFEIGLVEVYGFVRQIDGKPL
jgi:TLD